MLRLGPLVFACVLAVGLVGCDRPGEEPSLDVRPTSTSRAEAEREKMDAFVRCMREKGWDAQLQDGAVQIESPNDQLDAQDADSEACRESTGFGQAVPYTPAEVGELYEQLLEVADCVTREGFPLDDPPSEEFFAAGVAEGVTVWHPYDAAERDGQLLEVQDKCPVPEL